MVGKIKKIIFEIFTAGDLYLCHRPFGLGESVKLSIVCERRILGYFGHVMRREGGNLKK